MQVRTRRRLALVIGGAEVLLLVFFAVYLVLDTGWTLEMLFGLFLAPTAATGWVVASRVPSNPIGWLLLFISGCFLFSVPCYGLAEALVESAPAIASWGYWVAGSSDWAWIWVPPIGVMATLLLLLFPDGRLPSPRWRWLFWFAIVCLVGLTIGFMLSPAELPHGLRNPLGVPWVEDHAAAIFLPLALGMVVCVVGSVASLFIRYRHADGTVREQLRWVAWAAGVVVLAYSGAWLAPSDAMDQLVAGLYGLIPVSIGIAVLRFHLYDIDRIISRTVSYAVVTTAVVGIYAVTVGVVTRLLPTSSSLAVAAATLLAAASVRPLARGAQRRVDHRFNRTRYDAVRTVEHFSERLRSSVDSEQVVADLLATAGSAVQPRTAAVWLSTFDPHPPRG